MLSFKIGRRSFLITKARHTGPTRVMRSSRAVPTLTIVNVPVIGCFTAVTAPKGWNR